MAEIAPFHGILYEPARAGPLDALLAPPYDVVSPAERERLAARSPHAFVHVDLPGGDYAGAAQRLRGWVSSGALVRDAQPALYRAHQVFTHEGATVTRKGFIAAVRLRRYDERVVLPHERTLSGPKADRLALAHACGTHLSQVFGLYADPQGLAEAQFEPLDARPPQLEGRTPDGTLHRLWRLTDPGAHARVAAALAQAQIVIADGHHRYETMLLLRDAQAEQCDDAMAPSLQYGSFFLTRFEDPGLVVWPTHRALFGLPDFEVSQLLRLAEVAFAVEELPPALDAAQVRARLREAGLRGPAFALAAGQRLWLWRLRDEVALPGPAVLRRLDVTVLHTLVLERLLGISRASQEKQEHLRYLKDATAALDEARSGAAQAVFLLNPTRVAELRAVAEAGEVMPQKSTFFFPKLASGLVLARFSATEPV